jgi:hypothetical protein
MSETDLRDAVEGLRADIGRLQAELTRASAVHTLLSDLADRARRGGTDADPSAAGTAFARYVDDEDRPDALSYLTAAHVATDRGTQSALDAPRSPTTEAVDGFVADLRTYVTGGDVTVAALSSEFDSLLAAGTPDDVGALTSLFGHVVAAARDAREAARAALNNGGWEDGEPTDSGRLQELLETQTDDLAALSDDEPIALLPVRLETRFVAPNDDAAPRLKKGMGGRLRDFNRTAPEAQELRIRVYPDQPHVDSHETELTVQEEQWGRTFWAQVWFACQPPERAERTVDGETRTVPVHEYDAAKVPEDLRPVLSDLGEGFEQRFSTDGPAFYTEIKERAWNQLVERFGRQRGAYVVHATAPESQAQTMLTGYDDGEPFADGVPTLSFPDVALRPGSWSQQPVARLLPDRFTAVAEWRHVDDDAGDTRTVTVSGDAVRHPLPVGPNPERLGSDDVTTEPGEAPPGMAWMTDWTEARRAGMGLAVTAHDLDGTDPADAVFERLVAVGVRGSGATDGLEALLSAHHYTDGLAVLERGTPTNNSDEGSAGYETKTDPAESVAEECGPPLSTFGDFSDGDLLARALGISEPGAADHVFAHVAGADGRSQADARHMNALLWPATMGYSLQNLLVDNRWTNRESIWAEGGAGTETSFPRNPGGELGETLKQLDAWRRHFIRYVRAGGPFPALRIGRAPYGVLPASTLSDAEPDTDSTPLGKGGLADRIPKRKQRQAVSDRIRTPRGSYDLDTAAFDRAAEGPEPTGTDGTPDLDGTDDQTKPGTSPVGRVSPSGYSVTVDEPVTQVAEDLYGSSFDPAVPKSATSLSTLSKFPDGGSGVATRTRERAFGTDAEFPAQLRDWLGRMTGAWDDASENVDRAGAGQTSPDLLDRILGREANADDFVREVFQGYDALAAHPNVNEQALSMLSASTTRRMREILTANDLTELDPRLAWMLPPTNFGMPDASGDRPVSVVTDGREPDYLHYLYTEPVRFLRKMGWPVGLDYVDVDAERVKEALGWGDEIDRLSDRQLFVHIVLTNPEHGQFGDLIWGSAAGTINYDTQAAGDALDTYEAKLLNMMQTEAESLQNTLFKQVTRFATLQAYVGGRLRLGLKWDDLELGSENAFLSPDRNPAAPSADEVAEIEAETGRENVRAPDYTQQPIPDPSVVGEDTKTVWEWLDEPVPESQWLDGRETDYAELLWKTGSPAFDQATVDPGSREVFDAIAYLEARDADDVGRLFTETLDLASHRLDAWWTSLATRRLFEHRERQEAARFDGDDYAFVGGQFRRVNRGSQPALESGADGTDSDGATATAAIEGQTQFGVVENPHLLAGKYGPLFDSNVVGGSATETGSADGAASEDAAPEPTAGDEAAAETERRAVSTESTEPVEANTERPVTYVGAYGYVEDLHADTLDDDLPTKRSATGGTESEYIHAPSPQHATTAAVLRSGYRNHRDDSGESDTGDIAQLLDIDLSPGRVRAARQVLDGIRQGQMLGDLLGYRFERRLLERSRAFNESHDEEGRSIVLPAYKFALRRAFPGKEGQLEHGGGEDSATLEAGTAAAASDVLDGYRLFTAWQDRESDDAFFGDIAYDGDDATDLAAAMSPDERTELVTVVEEIAAIVDAVTDLLVAENVHQLGKGNFERAGAGIDDLVKGRAVADPEVAQTPRTDVGVTHRLGVTFGDPAAATVVPEWDPDSGVVDPETLPGTGQPSAIPAPDGSTPPSLQARPDAEPNLNAWLGDLLPAPDRVSCNAALTWEASRAVASGTFHTPTDEGVVSVDGLAFEPDLVVLELDHGVPKAGASGATNHYGHTSGVAARQPDGPPEQCSTSVSTALGGTDSGGLVDEAHALSAHLHAADGDHGRLRGSVQFGTDGFDVSFDAVDATEPLVVSYTAYTLADPSNVEVGTFTTSSGTGSGSVDLGVTADEVHLFGTTVATGTDGPQSGGDPSGTDGPQSGGDPAGFSRGVAVDGPTGVTQHAVAGSVDPVTGGHVAAVRDDRALHLCFGSGGSVAGTTSVQVSGLGETLDLSYRSTHAGAASDATRVVVYAAVGATDAEPAPALGVLDGSGRAAGDTETVTTGFRPGLVELFALPGVTSVNSDTASPVGGVSHGLATAVGEQHARSRQVRANDGDGFVGIGSETGGDALSLSGLGADGTVGDADTARLTSVADSGFTLTFPDVNDGDQVVAWRAWPAEPDAVTHVAERGVTLADLDLSPLDAVSLTQQTEQAGDSQLERRLGYYLARNPPAHEPPVATDATVELEFDTPAPDTTAADPIPVAAFLEMAAGVRDLVGGSRAMDGEDLGHPGESRSRGHTDASVAELTGRADRAQDRLAATGRLLANRAALLDPEDGASITDQVAALHDGVQSVTREVPVDGLATAARETGAALSSAPDAFVTDLERLREHLPAGSTDRASRSVDVALPPAPAATLRGDTGVADTTLDLDVWSTSAGEWFERSAQVTTDSSGAFAATLDLADVRPGTGFVAVLRNGATIERAMQGCVLVPEDARTVRPAADQAVLGRLDTTGETTVDVTLTELGADSAHVSTTLTTDTAGAFRLSADFRGDTPWTLYRLEAKDGGTTVFEGLVSVAPTPGAVVADSPVLSALLWIDDRADAFVPGSEGAAAALADLVETGTDWDTIRTELETFRDLDATAGTPGRADIDAVAALLDSGEGPSLEAFDLEAVDAAVSGVDAVCDAFGLDAMFDVTGRPDRAGGTLFWPVTDVVEDERTQARLAALLDYPDTVFDASGPAEDVAPELAAVLSRVSAGVYPRADDDVERLATYLRGLAEFLPTALSDPALQSTLSDPAGFVRQFRALVSHPDELATDRDRGAFLDDFRRFVRQPVLGQLLGVDDALSDVEGPYYDRDAELLGRGGRSTDPEEERANVERELAERRRELRGEHGDEALVWDLGLRTGEPERTSGGTPVSDCRFLLEGFRRTFLRELLATDGSRTGLPDTATSRRQFSSTLSARCSTLATVVGTQTANLDAARGVGAFDESFRTGVLETLRRALLRASYFGVYGSVPRSATGGRPADETQLVTQARTVHEAVTRRYQAAAALAADSPVDTTVDEQVARLEALFGDDFTVLPTFEPANGAELTTTFGRSTDLQDGDPLAAETWLQRVARVRDESATFRRTLSYGEALTGRRHRDLSVGQLPHRDTESWVGLAGGTPEPGRLSLVTQYAAGFDGDFTGPVAGLFVDELVENVPEATETTGIAVNYDDPDATAPNAVLLALPPADGEWSRDHLVDVVTDTMALSRYRMVDLEDMDEFGPLLPLLSFPRNDRIRPDAPSVDVDRIERYADVAPKWWQLHQATVHREIPWNISFGTVPLGGDADEGGAN